MDRHYETCSPEDAEEERKNFLSVLKAFRYYRYNFLINSHVYKKTKDKNNIR